MPIIWKLLIKRYLTILVLATLGFVAVILTITVDELARFAALGAPGAYVLRFVAFHIAYTIPIALPISALLSALLLFHSLSSHGELLSLRSSGYALKDILCPLLLTAGLIAIVDFVFISEVATRAHALKRQMLNQLHEVNPLALAKSETIARLKGFYSWTSDQRVPSQELRNNVIAYHDPERERMQLAIVKRAHLEKDHTIHLEGMTTVWQKDDKKMVVDNSSSTLLPANRWTAWWQPTLWTPSNDHLPFAALRTRLETLRGEREQGCPLAPARMRLCYSEMFRRLSLSLSILAFTLAGAAFGISQSRHLSYRKMVVAIFLALCYLLAFFAARPVGRDLFLAGTLYFGSLLLMGAIGVGRLWRVSRGIAT